MLLLIAVWVFLTSSCIVLLFFSIASSTATSEAGAAMSVNEIAGTIALASAPILLATILNEILVERLWRRVAHSALGEKASRLSNAKLAKNLRAANFEWLNFLKRMWKGRISFQDVRAVLSYGLLRWGSAISIASVQLCVTWKSDEDGVYIAHKRLLWVIVPVVLHACSIFGTMLLWLLPPWTTFSSRFDEAGLLDRYRPYLQRISGGSIASFELVAQHLESLQTPGSLEKEHKPGIQFKAKFKGIWFGLGSMCVPPAAAWAYTSYMEWNDALGNGTYRFAFHLVFLVQNIFYLLAVDFVIWNISLEGLCKTKHGKNQKPNQNLRHLGYSSGFMLLIKSFQQRRPLRAAIFLWLFWLQACLVRFLTVLYALCITVLSYGTKADQRQFYDPKFWLAWVIMTACFVFPLFIVWLFTRFQAPVCQQDGWRWAKIAQTALFEDGFYGVRGAQAVWGLDVEPFDTWRGERLS